MQWDEVNYFSPEQGSPQLKAWLGMQLNSSTQQLIQAQKWPGRDQPGTEVAGIRSGQQGHPGLCQSAPLVTGLALKQGKKS